MQKKKLFDIKNLNDLQGASSFLNSLIEKIGNLDAQEIDFEQILETSRQHIINELKIKFPNNSNIEKAIAELKTMPDKTPHEQMVTKGKIDSILFDNQYIFFTYLLDCAFCDIPEAFGTFNQFSQAHIMTNFEYSKKQLACDILILLKEKAIARLSIINEKINETNQTNSTEKRQKTR